MPDDSTNGAALALVEERVEAIEARLGELVSLRKDIDRIARLVLDIQGEMRNNQRALMDTLSRLEKRRG